MLGIFARSTVSAGGTIAGDLDDLVNFLTQHKPRKTSQRRLKAEIPQRINFVLRPLVERIYPLLGQGERQKEAIRGEIRQLGRVCWKQQDLLLTIWRSSRKEFELYLDTIFHDMFVG